MTVSLTDLLERYHVYVHEASKPELNKRIAKLTVGNPCKGCYCCKFEDGSKHNLKWDSLHLVNVRRNEMVERRDGPKPYGAGLFAKELIPQGSFIFYGEPPSNEIKKNKQQMSQLWRYSINHSCNPNCISTWRAERNDEYFFALKDIQPGEEIVRAYSSTCIECCRDFRRKMLREELKLFDADCLCQSCNESDFARVDFDDWVRSETHGLMIHLYQLSHDLCREEDDSVFIERCKVHMNDWQEFSRIPYSNTIKSVSGFTICRGCLQSFSMFLEKLNRTWPEGYMQLESFAHQINCRRLEQLIALGFATNEYSSESPAQSGRITVRDIDREIQRLFEAEIPRGAGVA